MPFFFFFQSSPSVVNNNTSYNIECYRHDAMRDGSSHDENATKISSRQKNALAGNFDFVDSDYTSRRGTHDDARTS